jgi:hypothetical protein
MVNNLQVAGRYVGAHKYATKRSVVGNGDLRAIDFDRDRDMR